MNTLRVDKVLRADKRGSSWPLIVEADSRLWLMKSHGAAQGPGALVAELVCANLAGALGLHTPECILLDFHPHTPTDDANDELADLLNASVGLNLGTALLDGAVDFVASDVLRVPPEIQAAILWLDGLTQNIDRTAKNPNMMWLGEQLLLIDFGAALAFQYSAIPVTESMPIQAGPFLDEHLFRSVGELPEWQTWDELFASKITRDVLKGAMECVPQAWLQRQRELYEAFLWKRLKWPRMFAELPKPEPRGRASGVPDWLRAFSNNR